MLARVKRLVNRSPHLRRLSAIRRYLSLRFLLGLAYGSYLTVRYVDDHRRFPAIVFPDGLIRLSIRKGYGARLHIADHLIVAPWLGGRAPSSLRIGRKGSIIIKGEFTIGDDVRINVSTGGRLTIGGRCKESSSGITARSVWLVRRAVTVGTDCLVAWDTFITDCDWHRFGDKVVVEETTIGDHVWIAAGAKILKGASIGDNSVVAAQAAVTSGSYPPRTLLAGVPARAVRSAIPGWHRDLATTEGFSDVAGILGKRSLPALVAVEPNRDHS